MDPADLLPRILHLSLNRPIDHLCHHPMPSHPLRPLPERDCRTALHYTAKKRTKKGRIPRALEAMVGIVRVEYVHHDRSADDHVKGVPRIALVADVVVGGDLNGAQMAAALFEDFAFEALKEADLHPFDPEQDQLHFLHRPFVRAARRTKSSQPDIYHKV